MPWSEWIQSDPSRWNAGAGTAMVSVGGDINGSDSDPQAILDAAIADANTRKVPGGPGPGDYIVSPSSPWADYQEHILTTDTPGTIEGLSVTTQQIAWFDLAVSGYPDVRDWFPAELYALTEGVDYSVRPDRSRSDQDAYIEYEPGGVIDFLGWQGSISLLARGSDVGTPPSVALAKVLPHFAQPIPGGTTWAGGGTTVAELDAPATSTSYVDLSSTLGTVTDFAIALTTSGGGTYIPPLDHNFSAQSVLMLGAPGALLKMPRWRYWKPDTTPLPLRQRQRDDGLGLSGTPRWRGGSSRQTSNRWRAYL